MHQGSLGNLHQTQPILLPPSPTNLLDSHQQQRVQHQATLNDNELRELEERYRCKNDMYTYSRGPL